MKKLMKSLMLVAVAAMGLTACQNDIMDEVGTNENTITVEVVANTPTRSQFGEKVDNAYPSIWTGDEKVMFSLNGANYKTVENTTEGKDTSFSVTFTNDDTTEGTIYAFSPQTSSATTGGFTSTKMSNGAATLNVPAVQTPLANSVDKAAHLLAAKIGYTNGIPTTVNAEFNHVLAYGKMTLKNLPAGVSFNSVNVTFPKQVAGNGCTYTDGTINGADNYTITLNPDNVENNVYWFGIVATSEMTEGTITVELDANNGYKYRKDIKLASDNKIAFNTGRVSTFSVNMEECQAYAEAFVLVTNVNDLKVEDQVVIAAKDSNYAMSTTQNSNNRAQASITKNGNALTAIGDDVQVATLKAGTTDGTYAFHVGSGYLHAASSSSNYLRTETTLSANSSWDIEIANDGTATVIAQGSYTRNWMRYNKTSSLFSCYGSGQYDICLYKKGYIAVEKPKAQRTMNYNKSSVDVVLGKLEEFEAQAPTLTINPIDESDGKINYSSSDDTIATVNASGEVTIVAEDDGSTTITAICQETDTYQEATASYTINVITPKVTFTDGFNYTWDSNATAAKTATFSTEYEGTYELNTEGLEHFGATINDKTITITVTGANETDADIKETLKVIYTYGTYTFTYTLNLTHTKKAAAGTATLSFADKANRTSFSASQQVWEQNGIKLTNNKANSTNDVADYANPARFYAKSEIIIEKAGMTKIEFTANKSSYATALKNSIGNTATASGSTVTVEFDEAADSITITLSAQVRMNSLTVHYE